LKRERQDMTLMKFYGKDEKHNKFTDDRIPGL